MPVAVDRLWGGQRGGERATGEAGTLLPQVLPIWVSYHSALLLSAAPTPFVGVPLLQALTTCPGAPTKPPHLQGASPGP